MEQTETLARGVFDAMTRGDFEAVGAFVTDDFVDHGAPPGVPQGRAGYIAILRWVRRTLEIRYELHDVVANGDLVAIRATAHGVHNSDHMGFPATGRPYAMNTMHLYLARDGKLAEHWGVRDELGALWQVGALTPPPLPAAFDPAGVRA